MKLFMLFGLIFSFKVSYAGEKIGFTKNCEKEVTLEANVGDRHVFAYIDGERKLLFPMGNYVFMKKSPVEQIYDSYNRRRKEESTSPRIIYKHPSYTMLPVGKIEISMEGKSITCEIEVIEF